MISEACKTFEQKLAVRTGLTPLTSKLQISVVLPM
jgi:hypothetical protein